MNSQARAASSLTANDCQTCGACCDYSREWPRFSLEDPTTLARIPAAYVDDENGRMRCDGNRCRALDGDIGVKTTCTIYEWRPYVCRDCLPGDEACMIARHHHGL